MGDTVLFSERLFAKEANKSDVGDRNAPGLTTMAGRAVNGNNFAATKVTYTNVTIIYYFHILIRYTYFCVHYKSV